MSPFNNFGLSYTNVSSINIVVLSMRNMILIANPELVDSNLYLYGQNITNLTVSAANIILEHDSSGIMIDNLDVFGCQSYEANVNTVGGSFSLHDTSVSNTLVILPINGDFIIVDNSELTMLTLTPSVQHLPLSDSQATSSSIGGNFNISNSPKLEELSLLGTGIKTISGYFNITNNHGLARVFLPNVSSIGGSILISNSTSLANISLPHLKSIGGALVISNSQLLTNLSLPSLESIGEDFIISNNSRLSLVTGFPSLQTITGKLNMEGNFTR